MARACIFCDAVLTGVRAKEHVIPQWLINYLGVGDDQLSLAVAQTSDSAVVRERMLDAASFVEGRVCADCNNGWMNDLEIGAMDFLKPLIEGQVNLLCLTDGQRTALAKWATKTGYVLSYAAPLKKVPPVEHTLYVKHHRGAVPPGVEVFGQQCTSIGDFRQIQRNQWLHLAGSTPKSTSPPSGSYKIAFQFRCLLLLVAHWADPNSLTVMSAGIHIPLWPVGKFQIAYHQQLSPLDMSDPMAPIARFSDTLAVADVDAIMAK